MSTVESSTRPVVEFDHHSSEVVLNGPELFRKIRDISPVAWTEAHGGYWVVTGYAELAEAARDDEVFSSEHDTGDHLVVQGHEGFGGIKIPPHPQWAGFMEQDPPETNPVRRLLNPFLSPAAVERLKPEIEDATIGFVDRVIESGSCDFIDDIGAPVPAATTLKLLGLPIDEWPKYASVAHALTSAPPGTEEFEKAWVGLSGIMAGLREEIGRRRDRTDADDILTALCTVEIDGRLLTDDEVLGATQTAYLGGVDTTTALLAFAVQWLGDRPEIRERFRQQPELLDAACEEFLRFQGTLTGLARTVTRPYVLGGQQLQAGDRILLCWAAANRDPREFEHPDEVRLDREKNRHCGFGLGMHRCVGSNIARFEFRTAMRQVLERMPDYVIDTTQVEPYHSFGAIAGVVRMPMTFTPGPRIGSALDK